MPFFNGEGKILRWLGINIDMSAAEATNAELERRVEVQTAEMKVMAEELHKAWHVAEDANHAKTRFLAGMSHEIRTLLNGILGYAQVLRLEGGLNETQLSRVDAMLGAGTHLLNLLGNALKFTSKGGVELRLCRAASSGRLRIEVVDTGPGIEPELRGRLFLEFERLQTPAHAKIEGSGLGLAYSARIVTLLGGEIGCDDRPGGGSIFWLELPPMSASSVRRRELSVADVEPGAADKSLCVLVADDVEINRGIAQAFLRKAGHQVTCVTGGVDAVAAATGNDYDVILMDVGMPDIDGMEATRRIRSLSGPPGTRPIIGVTAHVFADKIAECLAVGMNAHLAKPFTYEALSEAVLRAGRSGATARSVR